MDEHACAGQIARDLSELGIEIGNTTLVHSSFKSLGYIPGGIETVIQGLLRVIGGTGTLLMPALSWSLRPPEVFNARLTRTNVGAIPEYFRTRPGTLRSIHPTHSVCAMGRGAHELLDDHHLDNTACGPHSPFAKMAELEAKIIMLGCGLKPNTTMHALEEQAKCLYLFGRSFVFTIIDTHGTTYEKEYTIHGFSGFRQRYDRVAELRNHSLIRKGHVLEAETFMIETKPLRDAVLSKLRDDPLFFVERNTAVPSEFIR